MPAVAASRTHLCSYTALTANVVHDHFLCAGPDLLQICCIPGVCQWNRTQVALRPSFPVIFSETWTWKKLQEVDLLLFPVNDTDDFFIALSSLWCDSEVGLFFRTNVKSCCCCCAGTCGFIQFTDKFWRNKFRLRGWPRMLGGGGWTSGQGWTWKKISAAQNCLSNWRGGHTSSSWKIFGCKFHLFCTEQQFGPRNIWKTGSMKVWFGSRKDTGSRGTWNDWKAARLGSATLLQCIDKYQKGLLVNCVGSV